MDDKPRPRYTPPVYDAEAVRALLPLYADDKPTEEQARMLRRQFGELRPPKSE